MADFKRAGGFGRDKRPGGFRPGGDRPSFARKGGFGAQSRPPMHGRDDSRPPQMHQAVCADCGKRCEVPFRPNGERPVFCKDCFGDKRGNDANTPHRVDPRNDSFARPHKGDFDAPRSFPRRDAAPVAPRTQPDQGLDELKRQVDGVSKKLDALALLIEGLTKKPTQIDPVKSETKKPQTLTKVVTTVAKKAAKAKTKPKKK